MADAEVDRDAGDPGREGAPHAERRAYENRVRGVLTDSEFNGTQVTYFVRLPDGAEMRVIVADPFAQAPVSLGTALDLYWSPQDSSCSARAWCRAPRTCRARRPTRGSEADVSAIVAARHASQTEIKSHGRTNRSPLKPLTLALPVGYSIVFFLAPLVFLVILGFWTVENFRVTPAFTLAELHRHREQHARGLELRPRDHAVAYVSVTTAILVVALAYPFVLAIVYLVPPRLQRLVLLLAVAPFWTSYILRVFAWQILLAKRGVFNTAMQTLGLDGWQQAILNTQTATRIGLIHYEAPIIVVILYVTIAGIDRDADRGVARARRLALADFSPRDPAAQQGRDHAGALVRHHHQLRRRAVRHAARRRRRALAARARAAVLHHDHERLRELDQPAADQRARDDHGADPGGDPARRPQGGRDARKSRSR